MAARSGHLLSRLSECWMAPCRYPPMPAETWQRRRGRAAGSSCGRSGGQGQGACRASCRAAQSVGHRRSRQRTLGRADPGGSLHDMHGEPEGQQGWTKALKDSARLEQTPCSAAHQEASFERRHLSASSIKLPSLTAAALHVASHMNQTFLINCSHHKSRPQQLPAASYLAVAQTQSWSIPSRHPPAGAAGRQQLRH